MNNEEKKQALYVFSSYDLGSHGDNKYRDDIDKIIDGEPENCKNCGIVHAPVDIGNACHPLRQKAIRIIEDIIEPFVEHGIDGEEYYTLEDKLVETLNKN